MKKFLLAALKFILVVSLLLIVVMVSFGFVLWMSWPWWVGLFFLIGFAGLWLLGIFIQKLLLRRREQNFVQQVIQQDEAYLQGMGGADQEKQHELQARWKEAIDTLKSSRLKRYGNPLYVLPWYLIIGESGSGKTTAIKSANLSAPFTETSKVGGISGTRNCDWWFFDQAIILDTAGRYAIPVNEGQDKKEWQKFLSLLVKYRKKEPLNGLVITVSADKLLNSPPPVIENDAQNIRQRIDELMRSLGTRFPVYVLITKCDLIQGMTQFCDMLPEKCLDQAMGFLNQDLSTDTEFLHARLIDTITKRLRELRLLLLSQAHSVTYTGKKSDPEILLFPEEFQGLSSNLQTFIQTGFKITLYQETPILRGIYLSSGRQEGTPYSHFLNALGLIKPQEVLLGTSRGLFLHDLFSSILPEDKKLFAPTARSLAWNRLTRNIGVAAWVTIMLALCGLLSFSFVQNLNTMRKAGNEFNTSIALQGNILSDVTIMDRFSKAVTHIEEYNNRWWFPRFGLNKSKEIEIRLKEKYCWQFNHDFAAGFDRQLEKDISGFSTATPDEKIGRYAAHLTRRINLIKSRLDTADFVSLAKRTQPSFQPVIPSEDGDIVQKVNGPMVDQYLHYLSWQKKPEILREEIVHLQSMLQRILTLPGINLNWLATWVNIDSGLPYLTLKDFWGDRLTKATTTSVPPAFTIKGKELIDSLLNEIDSAASDPLIISPNKNKFSKWYINAYTQVWYDFGSKFPEAEYYLSNKVSWQQMAQFMADDKSPYFAVVQTMAKELKGIKEKEGLPSWISLLFQVERVMLVARGEAAIQDQNSLLSTVTKKGKKVISTLENKLDNTEAGQLLGDQLKAGKFFHDYKEILTNITVASTSRQVSYQMALDIFKDDPATSKSPFYLSQQQLTLLQQEITTPDEQGMVWRLISGPLKFLRDYVCLEASCQLNALWEKDVLVEIQGVDDKSRLNELLFEANGFALHFLQGPAEPFISRNLKRGFYPKTALGRMLPFKSSFLSFLNEGIRLSKFKPNIRFDENPPSQLSLEQSAQELTPAAQTNLNQPAMPPPLKMQSNYPVGISGQPTSVNKEAKIIPHSTQLELVCEDTTTRLVNLNYPVRKEFNWAPKNCEEVNLQIEVGSLVLKRQYKGKFAFPLFIQDFQSGSHNFKASDFPDEQKILSRMQIQVINVSYKFDKIKPILDIIAQEEDRLQAIKKAEEAKAKIPEKKSDNIAEALIALEKKQKQEELENEALKQAWKAKQAKQAEALKKAWEEKLPDVPREISTCWDQ
jgi:type VI secretion system protein ImpL